MKTLLSILCLFIVLNMNAQSQSTIVTAQTFRSEATQIKVPSTISCTLKNVKGSTLLVEAKISANLPLNVLNAMIKSGLFEIRADDVDGISNFYMPNLSKVLFYKGELIDWSIEWIIQVPEHVKLVNI